MHISDLNEKTLTNPAWVAFDDGTDTYKAEFNEVVADAAASAVADADLTDNEVAFTSGDALSPTAWTDVDVMTSGATLAALFNKVSTMIKNIRYLYSKISADTGWLDVPSKAIVGTCKYRVKSGICYVYIYTTSANPISASGWNTIGVLPSSARPDATAYACVGGRSGVSGEVQILTNGNVTLNVSGAANNISGSACFPVA